MDPFMDAARKFGSGLSQGGASEPQQLAQVSLQGQPEIGPPSAATSFRGWLRDVRRSLFGNPDRVVQPHETPEWNPGMERYATDDLFAPHYLDSPDMTREDWQRIGAETRELGEAILFGPERSSVIPFVDDASDPERLIRDWGLSEQEFRLSGQAFSEGRLGAGAGWGALAAMAAIPVVGWAGRGVAKAGRAVAKAATSGADAAPVLRAARSGDNILPAVESEFLSGNVRHTLPESIVQNIPEERRLFAEVLYRQGFSELPEVVSRTDARALAESGDWIPIYRGIRGGEVTRGADIGRVVNAEDAAFDLIHGNLYVSSGNAGHGAYFTTNRGWAKEYAAGTPANPSWEPGMVIDAYIPSSARIADGGPDSAIRSQYLETYGRNLTGQLDFNTWAAAQGYDAIRLDDTFIVLNRSILRMVEEPIPVSHVGFGARLENRQRFLNARSAAEATQVFPEAPLTATIPAGHVRLVHQTDASADALRSAGIRLDEARGIEGPRGVYAVEPEAGRGFYGEIENFGGVTVEFSIPAEEWARSGGVLNRSIRPDEIVAVHEPWHFHARRMSEGDVLSEIRSGELTREYFASLGDDWVRAYDHVVSDIAAGGRVGGEAAQAARPAQEIFSSPQAFEETGRTLYHGTPATFERFESASATWRGRGQRPTSSEGYFYFSDDPNVAASFRQNVSDVSVERWLERYPDMLFDFEDLRQPEIFQMFVDDVARSLRNQDLQIARDDYAQAWQSIRPQDLTVADVLDFDYPIRAVSPRGQVVETRVFGNELNLTGRLDPSDLPFGLREALEADNLIQRTGTEVRLKSWQGHEKGIPNTVEWMRENGYGRMVVPDAFESGGRSVIALEEYIEFGRSVDEVFETARAAAGVR